MKQASSSYSQTLNTAVSPIPFSTPVQEQVSAELLACGPRSWRVRVPRTASRGLRGARPLVLAIRLHEEHAARQREKEREGGRERENRERERGRERE